MKSSDEPRETRIATAPVSFGIFGPAATEHSPRAVMAAMVAAGFTGAELGPPGLFGSPSETAELFEEFEVRAVGAYVGLNLGDSQQIFENDLVQLHQTCEELIATGEPGLVILADEGDAVTRAHPARSNDHPIRWIAEQWDLAASRMVELFEKISGLGLTPSFHPHVGTYIENQREIETLLERTPIDLTIDTGHFLLGGIDPATALNDYRSRVNHLHIKDVRLDGLPGLEVTKLADLDDWWGGVSSPLGQGDVDLHSFLKVALSQQFPWLVIEQDRDPAPSGSLDGISHLEKANRQWLEDAVARVTNEFERL